MFSLICVWINGWANNREAGDLRRYRGHYDVIAMQWCALVVAGWHEVFLTLTWSTTVILALLWRHNERDGVSNHRCLRLPNHLFRRISKKTLKLRVTGLCEGIHRWVVNSTHMGPVTRKMLPFNGVIMSCDWTWADYSDVTWDLLALSSSVKGGSPAPKLANIDQWVSISWRHNCVCFLSCGFIHQIYGLCIPFPRYPFSCN